MGEGNPFEGVGVISVYTRQQALEDGMLVDVTETAREAGFTLPTAVTRNVWERCVRVPDGLEGLGQSEQGRLWDVLWLASIAARGSPANGESPDLREFQVSVVESQRPDGSPGHGQHRLWLHIGPGDTLDPVLTVMFPEDY